MITWNASVDDLYRTHRKAELVGGRLHVMEPTGLEPALGAVRVYMSLLEHQQTSGGGIAVPDAAIYRRGEIVEAEPAVPGWGSR